MGVVFLAYDATLERRLAIKVLGSPIEDESSRAQLMREARSVSALNHPNICTIYEVGEENGRAFIAMEYIDGRPLCDVVEAGPLQVEDALRYGIEAADALAHAHDRGVVHHDLKAANAIVSTSGRLKVVDFGLARRTNTLSDVTSFAETDAGMAMGHSLRDGARAGARTRHGRPHRYLGARRAGIRDAGGCPAVWRPDERRAVRVPLARSPPAAVTAHAPAPP